MRIPAGFTLNRSRQEPGLHFQPFVAPSALLLARE